MPSGQDRAAPPLCTLRIPDQNVWLAGEDHRTHLHTRKFPEQDLDVTSDGDTSSTLFTASHC